MMYSVDILRSAQRQLGRINHRDRTRIISAVQSLAHNPHPPGCQKLSGRPAWRIRVGSYRVIYEIHDNQLVVIVVTIGHRKDVYR